MALPGKNKGEVYEVRFHSIGGQGAYTTGQMLAAQVMKNEKFRGSIFADYGSEKKGAPVNVYSRFIESEDKITNLSAVKTPDLVVVFHEQLLTMIDVESGLTPDKVLIINTKLSPEEVKDKYGLTTKNIATIDGVAVNAELNVKINTIMYGTTLRILDFLSVDEAKQEVENKLKYRYPDLVDSNKEAIEQGFSKLNLQFIDRAPKNEKKIMVKEKLGYEGQIEGAIIKGANSYTNNKAVSREGYIPNFDKSKCINCTKCETTCPDDCFVWKREKDRRGKDQATLQGIDYTFCKSCLKCVHICPVGALTKVVETEELIEKNIVKKYEGVKNV